MNGPWPEIRLLLKRHGEFWLKGNGREYAYMRRDSIPEEILAAKMTHTRTVERLSQRPNTAPQGD